MKHFFALLILCTLASAHPAAASREAAVQRMTVKEAVKTALAQNHLIKAAGYTAEAARQGIAVATSRYFPGVYFEEAFAASNAPTQTFMMKLDDLGPWTPQRPTSGCAR